MTDADVIRLAREAGFAEWSLRTPGDLTRFAALVATAERERCAKIADDMDYGMGELAAAIRGKTG